MNKKFVVLIILILLLITGGVFWWQESREKETILTPELEKSMDVFVESIENEEIEDQKVLPEGIKIIKEDEKKIIKNEAEGFQIKVPVDFILKECISTQSFSLYKAKIYKEDLIEGGMPPRGVEKIYIAIAGDIPEKSYLKEITGEKEDIILGGEKGWREKFPFSVQYTVLKNNKIYFISTPLGSDYEEIVRSFKFLE